MKVKKTLILLIAAVLLAAICFAGAASADEPTISPTEKTIVVGEQLVIKIAGGTSPATFRWVIENENVLSKKSSKINLIAVNGLSFGTSNVSYIYTNAETGEEAILNCTVTVAPAAVIGRQKFQTVDAAFEYAKQQTTPQTIKLTADSKLTSEIILDSPYKITLDLNGHSLNAATYKRLFTVESGAKFTLMDSSKEQTGKLVADGGSITYSGGIVLVKGGKFIMESGTLTDCKFAREAGAVAILDDGTFIMNGGNITNCKNEDGGAAGVLVGEYSATSPGTFIMTGGNITKCSGRADAAAVVVSNVGSEFRMTGGSISDCVGVFCGGVQIMDGAKFIMEGGSIIRCTSNEGGSQVGGVTQLEGDFIMTGGIITDCKGGSVGGVLAGVSEDQKFKIGGDAIISGNKLTDGTTESNVILNYLDEPYMYLLPGKFTGRIGISEPSSGQFGFAEKDRFGWYPTGAENFVLDNSDPLMVGKLTDDETNGKILVWAEGRMVTFDPNNGEESWDKPVEKNTAVAQPKNPTMKGYNFAGWYNGDEKWNFNTKVTDDLTLTAGWEKKTPYVPSSSGQTGYTVILTEAPTQVPTSTPTPTATQTVQPIEKSTIKPTQSTTSKSPAPFAGLVLGLGAAAVLLRFRR